MPKTKKRLEVDKCRYIYLSFLTNFGTRVIPRNGNRLMVSGKLVAGKPQLEAEVGRRNNDANVKFANVVYVAAGKTFAALMLHDEFVLLQPVEVTCYLA